MIAILKHEYARWLCVAHSRRETSAFKQVAALQPNRKWALAETYMIILLIVWSSLKKFFIKSSMFTVLLFVFVVEFKADGL